MSQSNHRLSKPAEEDLAIQDTLSMTGEERLDLLASLIVGKIIADEQAGGILLAEIIGAQT